MTLCEQSKISRMTFFCFFCFQLTLLYGFIILLMDPSPPWTGVQIFTPLHLILTRHNWKDCSNRAAIPNTPLPVRLSHSGLQPWSLLFLMFNRVSALFCFPSCLFRTKLRFPLHTNRADILCLSFNLLMETAS